jgi:hypothetical protein
MAAPKRSGQVQGGNAQEGRRLRDQGSQYRAATICRRGDLYASVKIIAFLTILAETLGNFTSIFLPFRAFPPPNVCVHRNMSHGSHAPDSGIRLHAFVTAPKQKIRVKQLRHARE